MHDAKNAGKWARPTQPNLPSSSSQTREAFPKVLIRNRINSSPLRQHPGGIEIIPLAD